MILGGFMAADAILGDNISVVESDANEGACVQATGDTGARIMLGRRLVAVNTVPRTDGAVVKDGVGPVVD